MSNKNHPQTVILKDKKVIYNYLSNSSELNIYSIGDLDDFFWKFTTFYALIDSNAVKAIALLYSASNPPTLLALTEEPSELRKLLRSIFHLLPEKFYAHLSKGISDLFKKNYSLESNGKHLKMSLKNSDNLKCFLRRDVMPLSKDDLPFLLQFYKISYPENWFNPRMLQTGQYYGIKKDNNLIAVAGVHVFSTLYNVAALGNIATHPAYRGSGLGKAVTSAVCLSLLRQRIEKIGLNVKNDNAIAIHCYRQLGFEENSSYYEMMINKKEKLNFIKNCE